MSQVDRYATALRMLVATAKGTNAPTTADTIGLILTAAFVYCTDEAKMSTKDACDFLDARLGLLFEQLGQIDGGTIR